MEYAVAFILIALGAVMVDAGARGKGKQLVQAVFGVNAAATPAGNGNVGGGVAQGLAGGNIGIGIAQGSGR